MVSRIIKRTPTKTIKDCRISHHNRHRRRKSPIKNAAAAASRVVTSINKSICTCHRRLIKIFSKLARVGTPKRSPRKEGYQVLKKIPALDHQDIRRALFGAKPLPPVILPERKTVFLDLDETLIHSIPEIPPEKYDFVVRPVIDDQKVDFYVLKRPFVDEFLEILSKKFEIVVFTAGIKEYASLVLDRLDRRNVISHRLYRDSCKEMDGKFVKDLSELGRDLKRVVIVDDNPNSYVLQPGNAIRILPFTGDLQDGELRKVIEFFEQSDCYEDMRDAVKKYTAEEGDKTVEFKYMFNLYNLLENPYSRFFVYMKALNLAANGKVIEHIVPSFKKMGSFSKEWNHGVQDQSELFLTISNILKESKRTLMGYNHLNKSLIGKRRSRISS